VVFSEFYVLSRRTPPTNVDFVTTPSGECYIVPPRRREVDFKEVWMVTSNHLDLKLPWAPQANPKHTTRAFSGPELPANHRDTTPPTDVDNLFFRGHKGVIHFKA